MASIRKIKTKWEARVRVKGFPSYCKSFTKKSDAISWAKEVEVGLETGQTPKNKTQKLMTFENAISKYLAEISPTKKSHNSEKFRLKSMLDIDFAQKKLCEVTPFDLVRYRDKRLIEVKGASVRKELYLISAVFNAACKEWGIAGLKNPITSIAIPKDSPHRIQRLTLSERDRLLTCLAYQCNSWLGDIVELALETAMRRSEILNLKTADVNLAESFAVLRDTKNGSSRTIPLSHKARLILKKNFTNNERVFNITNNAVRLAWSRFQKKHSFEYLRFHDLRHEAVSNFFDFGLTIPEVAQISGHKNISQLFRYAHPDLIKLAKKLDAFYTRFD